MGIPFYPSLFSPSEDNDSGSRWVETKRLLEANPHLITLELLVSVLKQQPPTFVVELLLSHAPLLLSLLDMPKQQKGPTPLQVAVAEGCNVDVVKLLVQACPWALCVTNVNAPEDPLSLAKRLDQQDLQDLLQRPLVRWLQEAAAESQQQCNRTLQSSIHHDDHYHHHDHQQQHLQQEQQEDLANVKLLCARLLKRNQQLSKDIKLCQTTIQSLSMIQSNTTITRTPEQTPNAEAPSNYTIVQIRLEEEAVLNEVARNELVEWKQDMEQQLLVLFHHYHHHHHQKAEQPLLIRVQEHEEDSEHNPPPTSTTKEQGRESQRLLFNRRPNRRNVCRPFL